MLILAESKFEFSQAGLPPGPSADSKFEVDIAKTEDDSKFSFESVGDGAFGLSAPAGTQMAWLGVTHVGVDHLESSLSAEEGMTLTWAPDGSSWATATEDFSGNEVAGAEVVSWAGREVLQGGAPLGRDNLDFFLDIWLDPDDDTSQVRYPLITGGKNWDSTRSLTERGPMPISGGGYLGRFEGVAVDIFRKAAGVEQNHGEIIIAYLTGAGIPLDRIAISPSLGHALSSLHEISCFDGVAAAQTLAEAIGYFLVDDFAGNIVARRLAPVDLPAVATIRIERATTGEITAEISSSSKGLPTAIRVEGQRPEDPDAGAGWVTTRKLTSRVTKPYTTPATWSQNSGGGVTQLRAAFTETRIVSETWATTTTFNACVVETVDETWLQFNPETWRYVTADAPPTLDGEPRTYRVTAIGNSGFIFGDSVEKDDSSPARVNFDFRLHPTLVTRTRFFRDGLDGFEGALVRVVKSISKWGTTQEALKASTDPAKTWEEEVVIGGLFFFGDGRIVADLGVPEEVWFEGPAAPTFSLGGTAGMGGTFGGGNASLPSEPSSMLKVAKYASQEDTDIDLAVVPQVGTSTRVLQVETRRATEFEDYGVGDDGSAFQFRNLDESTDRFHEGFLKETVTRDFANDGESTHQETIIVLDGDGNLLSQEIKPGQPAELPRADICNAETNALKSTVKIVGRCEITETDLVPRVETFTVGFGMEEPGVADDVACRRLRHATALPINIGLPISPIFYAGAPVLIIATHKGIDPDDYVNGTTKLSNAWVEEVEMGVERDAATVKRPLRLLILKPIF